MKIFSIFIEALVLSYFMSVPVGPVGVLCVRRSLESGKWAGFIAGLGASFSDTFYAAVIAFNLVFISSFINNYRILIQVLGIIILLSIGLHSLFIKKKRKGKNEYNLGSPLSDFFNAFFVNITNPSIILSFGALLVSFHIDTLLTNTTRSIFFVLGIFMGSILWWLTVSTLASYLQKKIDRDIIPLIHKFSGILILLFAFFLMIFTFWEVFLH